MDAKINRFMSETGADIMMARKFLEGQHWDLPTALQAYSSLKDTILENNPPKEPNKTNASTDEKFKSTQSYEQTASANVNLPRRLSSATGNDTLMTRVRSRVEKDFSDASSNTSLETPVYTFTLPDLTIYPEDFREYLERDLLDFNALASLEQARKLNWWTDSLQQLWPLYTTGDGNCLLHAASLAMWGFHDRQLTLRRALHEYMMKNKNETALWRRWRWKQMQVNRLSSLILTEDEWKKEWDIILSLSSSEPKIDEHRPSRKASTGTTSKAYQGLEDIHVMALAQILKRPIVVLADTYLKDVRGDPFAPIPFGGVYLPLECSPLECHQSPLMLCYHQAHFSALAAMDTAPVPPAAIPLMDAEEELLPLNFLEDPGEGFLCHSEMEDLVETFKTSLSTSEKTNILRKYLDVMLVPAPSESNQEVFKKSDFHTCRVPSGHQPDKDLMLFSWSHVLDVERSTLSEAPTQPAEQKNPFLETTEQQYILCAMIHKDSRPVYQDQMKSNYIAAAKEQFTRNNQLKGALNTDEVRSTEASTASTVSKSSIIKCDIFKNNPSSSSSSSVTKKRVHFAEIISEEISIKETVSDSDSEEHLSRPCRNPTCEFFGNHVNDYFCSKCWREQHNEPCTTIEVQSQQPTDTAEDDLAKPCKNSACTFYGNPKTEYYCSKCWADVTTRSTLEEATPKDNAEEVPSYPCCNPSCTFFGNPQTYYFCSQCYRERLLTM